MNTTHPRVFIFVVSCLVELDNNLRHFGSRTDKGRMFAKSLVCELHDGLNSGSGFGDAGVHINKKAVCRLVRDAAQSC
jgi:hypothetical protein